MLSKQAGGQWDAALPGLAPMINSAHKCTRVEHVCFAPYSAGDVAVAVTCTVHMCGVYGIRYELYHAQNARCFLAACMPTIAVSYRHPAKSLVDAPCGLDATQATVEGVAEEGDSPWK